MSVFNRIWRFWKGTNRSGMVHLTGSFTVGSSGAVASSDTPGFKVTKQTAAGQYTVQLLDNDGVSSSAPAQPKNASATAITPWGIQAINATVVSAVASGTALTADSALKYGVRNFSPATGAFDLQFYKDVTSTSSETHVDTNIESGGIVLVDFQVKLSSVTP